MVGLRYGDVLDTRRVKLYDEFGHVFFYRRDVQQIDHIRAVASLYRRVAEVVREFFEVGAKQEVDDLIVVDVFYCHVVV